MAHSQTVEAQIILYNTDNEHVTRTAEYLHRAVDIAGKSDLPLQVGLSIGDCSPRPIFSGEQVKQLRVRFPHFRHVRYSFFNANLGSAAGHNRLLQDCDAEYVLIQNPDVLHSPRNLIELVRALQDPTVGIAEARQTPIEHPKAFDAKTGDTCWASTACILTRSTTLRAVGAFDAETFFLYCDDVDFSWRVRLAGQRVIYRPSAVVYHDKRLNTEGRLVAGPAERYFSAEAGLLLPWKYSRDDVLERVTNYFAKSGEEYCRKALSAYEQRVRDGRLPARLDPDHKIAQFMDSGYAENRYSVV